VNPQLRAGTGLMDSPRASHSLAIPPSRRRAAVYLDLEAVGVLAVDPGGHGPAGLSSRTIRGSPRQSRRAPHEASKE
jgi:hypothetical protein